MPNDTIWNNDERWVVGSNGLGRWIAAPPLEPEYVVFDTWREAFDYALAEASAER